MILDETRRMGRGQSHRAWSLCVSVTCGCVSDYPQTTSSHCHTISVDHRFIAALLHGWFCCGALVVVPVLARLCLSEGLPGAGDPVSRMVPSQGCQW